MTMPATMQVTATHTAEAAPDTVEAIARQIKTKTAQRPKLQRQLAEAERKLAEVEGQHEALCVVALIENNQEAQRQLPAHDDQRLRAEGKVRDLKKVLNVLTGQLAKLEHDRRQAERRETLADRDREQTACQAARQAFVARLETALREHGRPMLTHRNQVCQLNGNLGRSPGTFGPEFLCEAVNQTLFAFAAELPAPLDRRLRQHVHWRTPRTPPPLPGAPPRDETVSPAPAGVGEDGVEEILVPISVDENAPAEAEQTEQP